MKRFSKLLFLTVALLAIMLVVGACAKTPVVENPAWMFEVGTDAVTTTTVGSTEWAGTFNVNLKIVGGGDNVLFNGPIKITTNTQWVSEVVQAAVTDKGLAQNGIDVGFITQIGDYENNSETNTYWLYTVNGVSPQFGVSSYQFRDGDYILLEYKAYE